MGFDWEEILGDTDYEDAVDMAAEALERVQEPEEVEAEETDDVSEAENAEEPEAVAEVQTKKPLNGAGFMDGCDDEPVFN